LVHDGIKLEFSTKSRRAVLPFAGGWDPYKAGAAAAKGEWQRDAGWKTHRHHRARVAHATQTGSDKEWESRERP